MLNPNIILLIIVSIFIGNSIAQDFPKFKIIKNPKPNIIEKEYKYTKLERVKIISGDLGNDNYLYLPTSLTIDQYNNIYVYEKFEAKIYKFSEDFRLLKSFGRKGEGPGEFKSGQGGELGAINIGRDGKLYVNNFSGFKLIAFDLNGNYIREHKIPRLWYEKVIVDKKGNFYNYSGGNGVIDILDENMNLLNSLLNREEYYVYLFKQPDNEHTRILYLSDFWALPRFDLVIDDQLLVYLTNSSKIFLLKNGKIVNDVYIYPKTALKLAKERLKSRPKATHIFNRLVVDEDDKRSFYLTLALQEKSKYITYFYKFDLSGKLIKILYSENQDFYPKFTFKKNNFFYALEDSNITLYKEVTQ